ncbi:acetoin utilization AcuB family protein [Bacillus suaedaesalsae]|uniref:Acetoin utilization AcuB family protein n=1 Tax=Bacillus suaedaesalsae TaxID=2810349 RepID=A0ABS2DD81_9BACI|nr:acetoin utilization AcuB family protein [Bacillus suaedaesalsae]MBM6616418.1 acetoin utilization AcuB family protein [Bacillus suaedaesalsae]
MIVEEIMKKEVITLSKSDIIAKAKLLMFENRIRHLPVIDEKLAVVGLITRSDIYRNILADGDENRTLVGEVMNRDVITGHPLDFVEEVSTIFFEHKIGCLPIVKDEKLVGIITETDMLHTLVQLTGANQPGSQLEIRVPNKTGMLSEVAAIIKQRKVNILSVLVYPSTDELHKTLVFRVQTMNPLVLIEDLNAHHYDVQWPRIPGVTHE